MRENKSQAGFEFSEQATVNWERVQQETAEAMARVESNATTDVKAQVLGVIWNHFIVSGPKDFLAYHVTLKCRELGIPIHNDRLIGPMMVRAMKRGWITKTGESRPNPLSHGLPCFVWSRDSKFAVVAE